jgi:Transposase DDE domain
MFSIEYFIIAVFCKIDELLKEITLEHGVRAKGFAPALSDSEVMTMEIVSEYQGIETDIGIWKYFRKHWRDWFPALKSRTTFVRQAANLCQYKAMLQQKLAEQLGALDDDVHLIDGVPIPLCYLCRSSRCRSFEDIADYGYCASKDMHYYGFHGHVLISGSGVITQFALTPANGDERETLWDLVSNIHGFLIGDKGYLSQPLKRELQTFSVDLQTALRSNMHDSRPRWWVRLIVKVRRLIETVIGQLVGRFHLDKVWARDIWHLSSRLNRKILAHTMCFWLNRHSLHPLQFEDLVAS